MSDDAPRFEGEGRLAGSPGASRTIALELLPDGFTFTLAGELPHRAAYRDLATIAISQGTAELGIGSGSGALSLFLERFGSRLGGLVQALRDRRLRQRLADRFVELPDNAIELLEYATAGPSGQSATGVAQVALHERGFVAAPLDERHACVVVRRGDLGPVEPLPEVGGVRITPLDGTPPLDLLRLGRSVSRWQRDIGALREAAAADASSLLGALIPDSPFAIRDRASRLLVDGRPVDPASLGDAWAPVESAVLSEPNFAETYRILVARGGGAAALRWLAIAPEAPGSPQVRAWFLVALPGNLVAMELVSEGAHATYLFRTVPRAAYTGAAPQAMGPAPEAAVLGVSRSLLDARFLREPIGLPDERLAMPAYLRYRLALAALPSLAAARAMFVARLVHRDTESWTAALDDLVRWHASARDDSAVWPGRAAQEAEIAEAGGEAGAADGGADSREAGEGSGAGAAAGTG